MRLHLPALIIALLLAGCVEQGDPHVHHSGRDRLLLVWLAFISGAFGTLFPDTATNLSGVGDRAVTRTVSVAFLLIASVFLTGHYLDLRFIGYSV
jgi:hypothetical protein